MLFKIWKKYLYDLKKILTPDFFFCLLIQAYQEAIQSKRDIREALEEANHKLVHVNSTGPRVVHQSTKNKKVTDTEDTRHTREVQKDGKIITETSKTTEHEEV